MGKIEITSPIVDYDQELRFEAHAIGIQYACRDFPGLSVREPELILSDLIGESYRDVRGLCLILSWFGLHGKYVRPKELVEAVRRKGGLAMGMLEILTSRAEEVLKKDLPTEPGAVSLSGEGGATEAFAAIRAEMRDQDGLDGETFRAAAKAICKRENVVWMVDFVGERCEEYPFPAFSTAHRKKLRAPESIAAQGGSSDNPLRERIVKDRSPS
jgi:hypothetical protein